MNLYRVFPWIEGEAEDRPGGPLFVSPMQGSGRVDNPEHYLVLYAADAPAAAVAEAFGNLHIWSAGMLVGPRSLPDSTRALATYAAEPAILDLDDPRMLVERDLRPSRVVTRSRAVTQAWALRIYQERLWAGASWWSFYNSDWSSFGIWDRSNLEVVRVERMTATHPSLEEARRVLNRMWS